MDYLIFCVFLKSYFMVKAKIITLSDVMFIYVKEIFKTIIFLKLGSVMDINGSKFHVSLSRLW